MSNVFLLYIPPGNQEAMVHYEDTIVKRVSLERMSPFLSPNLRARLRGVFGAKPIATWGSVAGPRNRSNFERMAAGDDILIIEGERIKLIGKIAAKLESSELSRELWKPLSGARSTTWELTRHGAAPTDHLFHRSRGGQIRRGLALLRHRRRSQPAFIRGPGGRPAHRRACPTPELDVSAGERRYATRVVMQRLHQFRFRQLVIAAYRERCAVCRLSHVELLDAAHILPDKDERGHPEVPNGLALCGVHHGAFDSYILRVDPEYRVHIRRDILDEHDGPMLRHGLQELHGASLTLPRHPALHPNKDYLAERFARFRAA